MVDRFDLLDKKASVSDFQTWMPFCWLYVKNQLGIVELEQRNKSIMIEIIRKEQFLCIIVVEIMRHLLIL